MSEDFNFKMLEDEIVYSKEDIIKKLQKLDYKNKIITDIAMVGNDSLIDKSFFVIRYNNKRGVSINDRKKAVTLEDFDDDDMETVSVCTDYPIILKFDDNSTLELFFTLDGKYNISMNTIPFDMKAKCGNNVNISELFKDIKGSKIIDYKIVDLTEVMSSYPYVNKDKLTGVPIHSFELFFDNGLSMWFGHNSIFLKNKDDFLRIKFFDYLKYIPNYEEYFSEESIDCYTKEQKEEFKNQKDYEIDAVKEVARFVGYSHDEIMELLIYLFNHRDNVVKNTNAFLRTLKKEYPVEQPSKEEFDKLIHKFFD